MSAHREPGWVELLAHILRDSPRLEGNLCRDRWQLFDADQADPHEREYAVNRATGLCNRCPCLDLCQSYAAQRNLSGVVAGELHRFGDVPTDPEAKRKKPKKPRPKPKPSPAAVPA